MDSHKPLTAGDIEELQRLVEEYRICGDWTFFERGDVACFLSRLLSTLTPPPDAAVREAVGELALHTQGSTDKVGYYINTLLSYIWKEEARWEQIKRKCAEARVREMEATIDAMAEAHAHDDQALTAAYMNGVHEGKKQAEAFKSRVMAWARGSCGICAHAPCHQTSQGCKNCTRFRGGIPGEKADNWTPPQAWEVGE